MYKSGLCGRCKTFTICEVQQQECRCEKRCPSRCECTSGSHCDLQY